MAFDIFVANLNLYIPIFLVMIFYFYVGWRVFVKAGLPGWGAIIPIYQGVLFCRLAAKPGWWILLFLIPFVNLGVIVYLNIRVALCFGKTVGFGVGLMFLGFVFWPMLAFGDVQYKPLTAT